MATAGTRDSRNFWPSVGIGLIAGLVIVLVIFRFTAPNDVVATTSADDATNATGEHTNNATTNADSAAAVPVTTNPVVPTNPGAVASTPALTAPTTEDGAAASATSSAEATEPTIKITKTVGACKAGPECLIAGFTISGFPDQPSKFVCEFQDGSQFSYGLTSERVDRACYTSTKPGSITIVVNTTRSETITNP